MDQMVDMMEAFDFLCSVMSRNDIQSDKTIAEFRMVAKYIGAK